MRGIAIAILCSSIMVFISCFRLDNAPSSRHCCRDISLDVDNEYPKRQSDIEARVYIGDRQDNLGVAIYSLSDEKETHYLTRDNGNSWERDRSNPSVEKQGYYARLMKQESAEYINPYNFSFRYKVIKLDGKRSVIERSSDSGATWQTLAPQLQGCGPINMITGPRYFHPSDPNTILFLLQPLCMGGRGSMGMFVSHDGGNTLKMLYETDGWSALAFSKADPRIIYAAGLRGSVLKTKDAGETWRLVGQNDELRRSYVPKHLRGTEQEESLLEEGYTEVREIQIDPVDTDLIYLATTKGIIKSTDGGNRWCVMDLGVDDKDNIYGLKIDPNDRNTLFVGGAFGLLRSRDRGCRWEAINPGENIEK